MAIVVTAAPTGCRPQDASPTPSPPTKIEGLNFPSNRNVLDRHTATSDGQPVVLGPYDIREGISVLGACVGGGDITLNILQVAPASAAPGDFRGRHSILTVTCDGRHRSQGFDTRPSRYTVEVTFQGKVTDYEVIVVEVPGRPSTTS